PRRARECGEELRVLRAVVATHDAAQRGVRFERRSIDADRASFQEALPSQHLENESEHFLVHLDVQPLADPRQARVIRRRLRHLVSEETAQRERVCAAPCDSALAVDALEKADEQHSHVHARRNARPTLPLRVEARTALLDELVEARGPQDSIQLLVEGMARGTRQLARRGPEIGLLVDLALLHRQRSCTSMRILLTDRLAATDQREFFNGLLEPDYPASLSLNV